MRIKPTRFFPSAISLFSFLAVSLLLASADFVGAQTRLSYGTAEVRKGKSTTFFYDWDLCTDNSNNTMVDQQALIAGQSYFRGSMDEYGRIIELRHYDLNWVHRWTKRFYYFSDGQHRYRYFATNGRSINHKQQEARVRKHWYQKPGTSKAAIRAILGEPVITQLDPFAMEKWRYFDGVEQHWYVFNAKGELDYGNYRH